MKIMICYDGSEAGREALRVAQQYAKAFSAELHIVTSLAQKLETSLNDLSRREKAQEKLLEVKNGAAQNGLECVVALVTDDVTDGENLIEYAQKNKVDMVVIGVQKVSKVGKLLFGSTAQQVILGAPCPVISVK